MAAGRHWDVLGAVLRSFGIEASPIIDSYGNEFALRWMSNRVMLATPGFPMGEADDSWHVFVFGGRGEWAEHVALLAEVTAAVAGHPAPPRSEWLALYVALREIGSPSAPEPVVVEGRRLSVAWPFERVGLAMPSDSVSAFEKSGWKIVRQPVKASWPKHIAALADAVFAVLSNMSATSATNPSSQEQVLMDALLRSRILPRPLRDVQILNNRGGLVSQPDFAWPDVQLLLDLDGVHWHLDGHLDTVVGLMVESTKRQAEFKISARSRFEKDARKRRFSATLGWTVLTCTDTEIDSGLASEVVTTAERVYERLRAQGSGADRSVGAEAVLVSAGTHAGGDR